MAYVRVNPITIERYREWKIKLLTKQMGIILTREQEKHFSTLTTEIQVDNYARSIIDNAWDK